MDTAVTWANFNPKTQKTKKTYPEKICFIPPPPLPPPPPSRKVFSDISG